jgi:hypothetical protein
MLAVLTPVAGADSQVTASSLKTNPVQTIDVPRSSFTFLTRSQIASLESEITKRDPGRIWVLVVSPRSDSALGDLADPVFSDLPAGTLLAVAEDPQSSTTTNWWIGASWQSSDEAQTELNDVIQGYKKGQGSLYQDLRLEIQNVARDDAAAGHPTSSSGGSSGSSSGDDGDSGGSSGSSFPYGLVVIGAIILLVFIPVAVRYVRRSARTAHTHHEESEDAHAQAQKDFIKLGEAISALDIDSSLATASPAGKEEYRHALGCYEGAERRLKHPNDSYQFQKAQWAIKAGLRHVQAADQLFNPPKDPAKDVDDLERLADLHRRGALTDAEFAEQKAKLIK